MSGPTVATGAAPPPVPAPGQVTPPALRPILTRWLRLGVILSSACFLAGLAVHVATGAPGLLGAHGAPTAAGLFGGPISALSILFVGVVLLALTPVVRIAISLALFARAGDRVFVGLTGFVLAVLLISVVVGVLL
jgi:uncharacterized membrane protein